MQIHIAFILLLQMISIAVIGQTTSSITYIANEGFMIEQAGKKVLIDGLFDNINEDWCDSPTDAMIFSMKRARAPFDDIDIVLVSHKHRDHFNADVVSEFLWNSPNTQLICTKQTREMLSGHPLYPEVKNRVLAISPFPYSDTNLDVSEINLRVIRMEHSHYMIPDSSGSKMINKHSNIENLCFIIDINGIEYFHSGDANPKDEDALSTILSNSPENIDVAFLDRGFISRKESTSEIVENYLRPEYTFVMHLAPADIKAFSDHFSDDPQTIVFQNKLEQITITVKK